MESLLEPYYFKTEQLREICKIFSRELRNGLAKATHHESSVKCFPTFVNLLPTGEERCDVLVLAFKKASFHILHVRLKGNSEEEIYEEIFQLKSSMKIRSTLQLFDYIAGCLIDFVKRRGLSKTPLPLGITIPFPCTPQTMNSTDLWKWLKGYDYPGNEATDIKEVLMAAIGKQHSDLKINTIVILSESVGTLISCARTYYYCLVSCRIGTTTNACYVERASKIETLLSQPKGLDDFVIINTEWGGFGDNGCLDFVRTPQDEIVDQISSNPGQRIFEKMTCKEYVCELVRLLLVEAVQQKLIFEYYEDQERLAMKLSTRNVIWLNLISTIVDDEPFSFEESRRILETSLGLQHVPGKDMCQLHDICKAVFKRSTTLIALCLGVIVNRVNETNVGVGIDGCIYDFGEAYNGYLERVLRRVVHSDLNYEWILSENGPSIGAAIIAALSMVQAIHKHHQSK